MKINNRVFKIIKQVISDFEINLDNLNIITEAASGYYLYNTLLAAQSGAIVHCFSRNSKFGKFEEIKSNLLEESKRLGCENKINIYNNKNKLPYEEADILLNMNFIRPIDAYIINRLKKSAVISLMWETWEFRADELDLNACKENEILCLGVDESHKSIDMDDYAGVLAFDNLIKLSLEVHKTKIVLIGSNKLARRIYKYFKKLDIEIDWFSQTSNDDLDSFSFNTKNINKYLISNKERLDVIICAELHSNIELIGKKGVIEVEFLKKTIPSIKIASIAGKLDFNAISNFDIDIYPRCPTKPFYMSNQLYNIGPKPILELFGAGLKVGMEMSYARRNGLTIKDSIEHTFKKSPAMDFVGDLSWT